MERRRRLNYAAWSIGISIPFVLMSNAMQMTGNPTSMEEYESQLMGAMFLLIMQMGIQIYLAIGRVKDMNKSPWFALIAIIPFVCLYLFFAKGTEGTNQYGEDPRKKG